MKKFIVSLSMFATLQFVQAKGLPQEYYDIKDVNSSKEYFLEHLYELIQEENSKILQEREFVIKTLNNDFFELQKESELLRKLVSIKVKYKIENLYTLEEYLKKIDVVPPSLALAQAAVESAWGKSRFIKEANNIFGHWTYNKDSGIVPKKRELGKSHFIRVFGSLEESIKAYMLNLNRNKAYESFQEERYQAKLKEDKISGLRLSQTMLNYSGIANKYLDILSKIILSNNLESFDNRFFKSIAFENKAEMLIARI